MTSTLDLLLSSANVICRFSKVYSLSSAIALCVWAIARSGIIGGSLAYIAAVAAVAAVIHPRNASSRCESGRAQLIGFFFSINWSR